MYSDYDNWKIYDRKAEADERCYEGDHDWNGSGYCRNCGEESGYGDERYDRMRDEGF